MTLIIIDGCQTGGGSTKWGTGSFGNRVTPGRFTGSAAYSNQATLIKDITPTAEVFAAAAFLPDGTNTVDQITCYTDGGTVQHVTVFRTAAGFIEARRGTRTGTLLATGTTPVPDALWYHLQVHIQVADSGGVVQVRLNGAGTNEINFTGDTKNGGTSTNIDRVTFRTHPVVTDNTWISDIALLDGTGTVNNTWPGDCRVQTLVPNGNGDTSQGVGSDSDSTNNYLLVDELPFSSTDYVGFTTDGEGDTYTLTDLAAATTTVKGVQLVFSAAKSDAGTKSIKRRMRSVGTTYVGSSIALGTSYQTSIELFENDPATAAAWTVSGVNALEAGAEAAT